ncbi:MAG: glycosyltransferase [Candidatus Taylorbacteria bacterium]|nr:glycosyltransferase [Candidatus Taylorbacteria bacterium]
MKVLSIGSDRKLFEEGSAVRARLVEYASLFDELHLIVFSRRTQLTTDNLQLTTNCWVYPTNSWSRWFYIFDAIRIGIRIVRSQKSKVNGWVVSAQDPFETGLVVYRLARRFRLPLHIQIHTDFLSPYFAPLSMLNRLRVFIASRVLPRANAIRVVSERIKNSLSKVNGQMSNVSVLPIWSDLTKFQETPPSFDLKQKYPQWSFIILAAARLSPEKNVGFALRILSELLKKYPKVGLVIVGDGPLGESLKFKVKSLKLEEHIAFEGWQDNLASYYKTANLFLQTSLYEGYGLSLLEALASGCPAVSSDVGIAPELLIHKGHSFVCPVNNLQCFVSTISRLIEDNQLRTFFSLEIAPAAVLEFSQSKKAYLEKYLASIESARM